MIVVTGANGPFGRQVVEQLVEEDVVVTVRGDATYWSDRGLRVHRADFDHPETLPAAFAGADVVLINGTNYGTPPDQRRRQQTNAIQAARAAGVSRIILTSFQDVDRCPLPLATDIPATERLLGPTDTILRINYGMAASLARDVLWAIKTGTLRAPAGDARATPADTTDLAEATAAVLTQPAHAGRRYELSGPDSIGWPDLAELASRRADRPIAYEPTTDDEFRTSCAQQGFPTSAIDGLLAYYAAFRDGWANTPTTDLATLLGHPPTSAIDAVAHAADAWAW